MKKTSIVFALLSVNISCMLFANGYDYSEHRIDIFDDFESTEKVPSRVDSKLIRSMFAFVIEMRVLYPEKRAYLARDGEYFYAIDKLLWDRLDKRKTSKPILINVSTAGSKSAHLEDYLNSKNLEDSTLIDTAFDGTVPDHINAVREESGLSRLRAHLVTSSSIDYPSSRISTGEMVNIEELGNLKGEVYKEAFLDVTDKQVEAIEDLPHATASSVDFRLNSDGKWDAFSLTPATDAAQSASEKLMLDLRVFFDQSKEVQQWVEQTESMMKSILYALSGASKSDVIPLQETAYNEQTTKFFLLDVLESAVKGNLPQVDPRKLKRILEQHNLAYNFLFDFEKPELLSFKLIADRFFTQVSSAEKVQLSPLSQILSFHKAHKKPSPDVTQAWNQLQQSIAERTVAVLGKTEKIVAKLGEGVRGDVYETENGLAVKVAADADSRRYLVVEVAVANFLEDHRDKYGIEILPILEVGYHGNMLVRKKFDPALLGESLVKKGLSKEQLTQLEALYLSVKRVAEDTGIGLDTKSDNVVWLNGSWVLFDLGPRTSYAPYAFSIDNPDFATFLRLWSDDDYRKNDIKVEDMVKRLDKPHINHCALRF